MPFDTAPSGQHYGMIFGLVIMLMVLVLRNRRPRPLRVELLWVRPVILLVIFGVAASAAPPPLTVANLLVLVVAAAIGVAVGWQRGRFMRIEVDPQTHAVTSRASILGVIFILAVLLLRMMAVGAMHDNAAQLPISPIVGSDALLVLLVVMLSTQGVEMWLRARRLLAEAQAARLTTSGSPPLVQ